MSHASESHASEYDSHGHAGEHGHVIVSQWTLMAVLGALLFFTLLTVGASIGEQWLADVFHIVLPGWVNVAVALSIAAVKTVIVVAYFMQLKYDNPLNTMILVFTVLTVMFFLGFTAIDLGQRGTLEPAKAKYVIEGGTGLTGEPQKGTVMDGLSNTPITQAALKVAKDKKTYDPHHGGHEGHGEDRGPLQSVTDAGFAPVRPGAGSSAQNSRPVRGVTIPGLPGYVDPHAAGGHGDGHGHATEPAKTEPAKSEPAKSEPAKSEPAKH